MGISSNSVGFCEDERKIVGFMDICVIEGHFWNFVEFYAIPWNYESAVQDHGSNARNAMWRRGITDSVTHS